MSDRLLLSLNMGSATLKAAHHHLGTDGALHPHGGRLEVDAPAGATDLDDTLERVVALLPGDARMPDLVAHRIVHGGGRSAPAELDEDTLAALQALCPQAPLHQPAALRLVRAARARWPGARHVAVFDSAFHASLDPRSRRLPLPDGLHRAGLVRRGFHGLAFQSVLRRIGARAPMLAGKRLVLAHLGSGCSLCAVAGGRSLDTTMGATPLDGLPMATRSGSLDPGVVLLLQRQHGLAPEALEQLLWHESGLRGMSGQSGDLRVLLASTAPAAREALALFVLRIAQGVAAMATTLGGLDALVFSGGMGARSPALRAMVLAQLAWLGLQADPAANAAGAWPLSAAGSSAVVLCVEVDEERELSEAAAALA